MVEILIITVLVLWSCIIVFKKLLPKTHNKVATALFEKCQSKGWHRLGKIVKPKVATGCGGSCGCGSENESTSSQEISTVKWK